jgi:hypothetical protein
MPHERTDETMDFDTLRTIVLIVGPEPLPEVVEADAGEFRREADDRYRFWRWVD